jgi:hypothetical protein
MDSPRKMWSTKGVQIQEERRDRKPGYAAILVWGGGLHDTAVNAKATMEASNSTDVDRRIAFGRREMMPNHSSERDVNLLLSCPV